MAFYDSDPAIAAVILLITKNIALPLWCIVDTCYLILWDYSLYFFLPHSFN
jgi:hypothetical protein